MSDVFLCTEIQFILPRFGYQNTALYGYAHTYQEHGLVLDTSIQQLATKSDIINRRTHNALQELLRELSNVTSEGV
jgi:phosphoribosylaminoimidazole carboxylase (NCAIR synthetase)